MPISVSEEAYEMSLITPILQMWKLRHREVRLRRLAWPGAQERGPHRGRTLTFYLTFVPSESCIIATSRLLCPVTPGAGHFRDANKQMGGDGSSRRDRELGAGAADWRWGSGG